MITTQTGREVTENNYKLHNSGVCVCHCVAVSLCSCDTNGAIPRAGNWWKITARNRTTVHYGEPLQTVVNNCNPQFTRRTK